MRAGTSDAATAIGFDFSDMRTLRDGKMRANSVNTDAEVRIVIDNDGSTYHTLTA
jgi:hypothetical protein